MKHLFFLLLFFIFFDAFSQEVTGVIVDQEGKPLEGVNILVSNIKLSFGKCNSNIIFV